MWLCQEHRYCPFSSLKAHQLTSCSELQLPDPPPKQKAIDGCAQKLLYVNYLITANDWFVCVLAHVSASHSLFEQNIQKKVLCGFVWGPGRGT